MPEITEEALINLHKQIEREKENNLQLLDLIHKKNKSSSKKTTVIAILIGLVVLLVLGFLMMGSYYSGQKETFYSLLQEDKAKVDVQSYNTLKAQNDTLSAENALLTDIKNYYLARNLINDATIYAVQVKSISDNHNLSLASNAFTNTQLIKAENYLKLSLGAFETIEEARQFRNTLVKVGLEDAFVASYKNGKRIKIEE